MSGDGDSGISRGAVSRAMTLHQLRNILAEEYFNGKRDSSNRTVSNKTHIVAQSESSKRRQRYRKVTDSFLKLKIKKKVLGRTKTIRFTSDNNKHLYSDTFKRCNGFKADDLRKIPKLLKKAQFVKFVPKDKEKAPYDYYYYFRVRLRGKDYFINVGQLVDKNGKSKGYYVYSITNRLKEKTK